MAGNIQSKKDGWDTMWRQEIATKKGENVFSIYIAKCST